MPVLHGHNGINHHVQSLVREGRVAAGPPTQEVERGVVGNSKEPALDLRYEVQLRYRLQRLHQRVLHHVLAIDGGARHAGAIPVQLRPHLAKHTVEGRADLRGISVVVAHYASAVVSRAVALLP